MLCASLRGLPGSRKPTGLVSFVSITAISLAAETSCGCRRRWGAWPEVRCAGSLPRAVAGRGGDGGPALPRAIACASPGPGCVLVSDRFTYLIIIVLKMQLFGPFHGGPCGLSHSWF